MPGKLKKTIYFTIKQTCNIVQPSKIKILMIRKGDSKLPREAISSAVSSHVQLSFREFFFLTRS